MWIVHVYQQEYVKRNIRTQTAKKENSNINITQYLERMEHGIQRI